MSDTKAKGSSAAKDTIPEGSAPVVPVGDPAAEPHVAVPTPAADPEEGQKAGKRDDEQLNDDPAPEPAPIAGTEAADAKAAGKSAPDAGRPVMKDTVRHSVNTVWCPKDGLASPIGTDKCPSCGFVFEKA